MALKGTYYYLEWVACGYCGVLLLILCFYLYHFYKRRRKEIFKKRFFWFIFSINICSIFFVGYLAPMWILTHMTKTLDIDAFNTNIIDSNQLIIFDLILGFPYIICQHFFTFLLFCRFWLLHFQIKYTFHSKQLDILTRINPTANQLSWYIRNRITFGSQQFCFRITLIISFLFIGISSFIYWLCFDNNNLRYIWYLCDSILLLLPLIGAFIIWYNTPSFFDYFLIRKELSIIIVCGSIGIIGYIITIILFISYIHLTEIAVIIGIIFGATIYSTIALTSTFWVLQYSGRKLSLTPNSSSEQSASAVSIEFMSDTEHLPNIDITGSGNKSSRTQTKSTKTKNNNSNRTYIPDTMLKKMTSQRLYSDGMQRPENDVMNSRDHALNIKELTLYNCLENKYGFYAFLCHAFKEYSIENVLAVVEFKQFQTFYEGKKRDQRLSIPIRKQMSNNMNELLKVPSYPTTPISRNNSINSIEMKEMKEMGVELKNIASESRSNLDININKKRGSRLIRMTSMEDLFSVQIQNHTFNLPPNLPNSSIVFDVTLSMREKIVALCDKYIVTGGEYELNLGSSHRSDLLKKKAMINNINDDECAAIFNDTIYGVIALMHDSFIRFQQTNSYEQLRKDYL